MIKFANQMCLLVVVLGLGLGLSFAHANELGSSGGAQSQSTLSTVPAANDGCFTDAHPPSVNSCGFDALRAQVKSKGPGCVADIKDIVCHKSMWSSLGLQDRVQRVIRLAVKQSQLTPAVDYRALPCLTRRESIWFDPSIVTFGTCSMETTDQGLGQVVFSTFKDMFENQGFRSRLAQFSMPPYSTDARTLFSAMAMSADLQIEVLEAVLAMKLRRAKGDYQQAFSFYNGAADRVKYGTQVNACYQCVKAKLPEGIPTERDVHTNIDECLDQAMDGNGVQFSFTKFATECRGETFDRWSYWTSLNIDPTTKGLDPITHQPIPTPPAPVNPAALSTSPEVKK